MYYKVQSDNWEAAECHDDWLLDDRVNCYYFSNYEKAKEFYEKLLKEAKENHEVREFSTDTYREFETTDRAWYGYKLIEAGEIPDGYEIDNTNCVSVEYYSEEEDKMKVYEICNCED